MTPIVGINFDSPNLVDDISRSYMKIQDLLAKVGGMINALIIIMKIMTYNYIRFLYLTKLVILSKKDASEADSNLIKIDKIQIKDSKFIPNKRVINNEISSKQQIQSFKVDEVKINQVNNLNNSIIKTESKVEINKYYLKYLIHKIFCNSKNEIIEKEINLINRKVSLNTMIRIVNYFHSNDIPIKTKKL